MRAAEPFRSAERRSVLTSPAYGDLAAPECRSPRTPLGRANLEQR